MEIFNRREKRILLTLLIFVLAGVGVHTVRFLYKPKVSADQVSFLLPEKTEPEVKGTFTVQVVGEVNNPGIYSLKMGLRVKDAISAAGGAKDGACTDALNLALPLLDGMRIYVPAEGAPLDRPESFITYGYGVAASYQESEVSLDLNTATVEQLISLPGIGEVRATRIIEYREEHGEFTNKKELLKIEGIGEKLYREIEGKVQVK